MKQIRGQYRALEPPSSRKLNVIIYGTDAQHHTRFSAWKFVDFGAKSFEFPDDRLLFSKRLE